MGRLRKFLALGAAVLFALSLAACTSSGGGGGGSGGDGGGGSAAPSASNPELSSHSSKFIGYFDGTLYYGNFTVDADEHIEIPGATKVPFGTMQFLFYNGRCYHTELPKGSDIAVGNLYQTDANGNDSVLIADNCELWSPFFIVNDKLYYTSCDTDSYQYYTYVVDLNDSSYTPTELKSADGSSIQVHEMNEQNIYYSIGDDYYGVYKANLDMTGEEKLQSGYYMSTRLDDEGDLVAACLQEPKIEIYPADGSKAIVIDTNFDASFAKTSGTTIYALDGGTTVNVFDCKTGEKTGTFELSVDGINSLLYIDDACVVFECYDPDWDGDGDNCTIYYQDRSTGDVTECGTYFSS